MRFQIHRGPSPQPSPPSTGERGNTRRRVIVVGGGLAGMAAAVALESAGARVTLLEARKRLGGRAGSFEDPQSGRELDNCQHVLLGCCTNLLDFYRRIGAAHLIRFERAIHLRDRAGRRHDLAGMRGLPAPLHLGPSILHFSALTWRERTQAAKAMLAMMRLGRAGRRRLADVPFGQWLDEHRQSAGVVRKLYDTVLVGALNEETRAASAEYAIKVFQDSLLAHARGYPMGVPTCPLSQLYATLPCRDVRLGVRATGLAFDESDAGTSAPPRVRGVELQSGEVIEADAVILATNHHTVPKWIPPHLLARDLRFAGLGKLESVPILGVHLSFDRPVMTDSHAALLDGPLQWVFRKDADGRKLHGVISAARDWVDRPREQMLPMFESQIRETLPGARDAKLEDAVVVIEKRATFAPTPGVDRHRPPQSPPPGGIADLYLAGDYTQTGWPATMEGAVRSGYLAADAVLGRAPGESFVVADLPVQWPGRLLAAG